MQIESQLLLEDGGSVVPISEKQYSDDVISSKGSRLLILWGKLQHLLRSIVKELMEPPTLGAVSLLLIYICILIIF